MSSLILRPPRSLPLLWRKYARKINTNSSKSDLSRFLAETIKATGPIQLSAYMRQCLTNPSHGYYVNHDPFGRNGDFITSPEISQMFGELVGIWMYTEWMSQKRPTKIKLVELGPGRGTLMADVLRTLKKFPIYNHIDSIQLIEASPLLREKQRRLLCGEETSMVNFEDGYKSSTPDSKQVYWFDSLKQVVIDSAKPFIIAHEFFDALPILQFENTPKGWRERRVDYSVVKGEKEPRFHLTLTPYATPSSLVVPMSHPRYKNLPVGSMVEICPQAWDITQYISLLISKSVGGCALIVDYGPTDTIPINTLRGIRNHKLVDPFDDPGTADLSADVDFNAIQTVATESKPHSVAVYGPQDQGTWLHELGIGDRASMLYSNNPQPDAQNRIKSAYHRLTDKTTGAMGKVYKVLALLPKSSPRPVGFGGSL